jgi:hypothetical protein
MYLTEDAIDAILDKMVESGSVQLHNFLLPERHDKHHGRRCAPSTSPTRWAAALRRRPTPPACKRRGVSSGRRTCVACCSSTTPARRAGANRAPSCTSAPRSSSTKCAAFSLSPAFARLLFALCGRVVTAAARARASLSPVARLHGGALRRHQSTESAVGNAVLLRRNARRRRGRSNADDDDGDDGRSVDVAIWRSWWIRVLHCGRRRRRAGGGECRGLQTEHGRRRAGPAVGVGGVEFAQSAALRRRIDALCQVRQRSGARQSMGCCMRVSTRR